MHHTLDQPAVASQGNRWGRFAALAALALVLLGALALRLPNLDAYGTHVDEGTYFASAALLARGYPLFEEVFSSQGPLFLAPLGLLAALCGAEPAPLRLAIVASSLLALLALAWLLWQLAGPLSATLATALLAASPWYLRNSRLVLAEVPALALALLALAAAAHYARHGRRRWLVAASCLLALSFLVKPITLGGLLPLALLIAARHLASSPSDLPPSPSPEGEGGMARPLAFSPFPAGKGVGGLGPLLTDLALALGVGLVTLACAALLWNPMLMWEQVIGLHAMQQDEAPWMIGDSLERLWPTLLIEGPGPLLLAALGGAVALWRRQAGPLLLLLWTLLGAAILLTYQPLYERHVVVLLPGVAGMAGIGASAATAAIVHAWHVRLGDAGVGRTVLIWAGAAGGAALLAATAAVLPDQVANQVGLVNGEVLWEEDGLPGQRAREVKVADEVADLVPPGAWLLTDYPPIAVEADRLVPPPVVDASRARIRTGSLTAEALIAATEGYQVDYVMLWTSRFNAVPTYERWLKERFELVRTWGKLGRLYVRRQPPAVAAGTLVPAAAQPDTP